MRTFAWLTVVTITLTICTTGAQAQDKKSVADTHGAQALIDSLRDVIDTGADLFNNHGDYAGCYRIYQGGLLAVKPFLTPQLQKRIVQSIARAEQLPRYSDRAFELRSVLDEIRSQSKAVLVAAAKAESAKAETVKDKSVTPEKVKDKSVTPEKVKDKSVTPEKVKDKSVTPEKAKDKSAPTESKQDVKKPAPVDPDAGKVGGTVTYNGKPAPPGFVTLVGAEQRFSATITDGAYAFRTPIPPGRYRIAVERTPGAKIPPNLDIPERYRSEATSGLTMEVQRGKQVFNIDLVR